MQLCNKVEFLLKPRPPFHFEGTLWKPSHFPVPIIKHLNENEIIHTMTGFGKVFGVKLQNIGGIENPLIHVTIYSYEEIPNCEIEYLKREIVGRYGINEDISEFIEKFKFDEILGPVLQKWKGMRVSCVYSLYELAIVTIVLQNTNVKRSEAMLKSLLEKYGREVWIEDNKLLGFWKPDTLALVSEEELRKLKLGYRAKYIKRISKVFASESIKQDELKKIGKEKAKQQLLKLPGIGLVSSQILLVEYCRYYDSIERLPPWDQEIYSQLILKKKNASSEEILAEAKRRWGDWKDLAMHYLWEDFFWKNKERTD